MNHYTNYHLNLFLFLLILVHTLPLHCIPTSLDSVNLDSIEWFDNQEENILKDDIKDSSKDANDDTSDEEGKKRLVNDEDEEEDRFDNRFKRSAMLLNKIVNVLNRARLEKERQQQQKNVYYPESYNLQRSPSFPMELERRTSSKKKFRRCFFNPVSCF